MRPDFQFSIVTTKTYIFLLVNSALNSFFFSIQGYAYNYIRFIQMCSKYQKLLHYLFVLLKIKRTNYLYMYLYKNKKLYGSRDLYTNNELVSTFKKLQ